jgi:hypothetical protein
MIRRNSIVGIAALVAIVVCAFAAANASAEQKAFSCQTGVTPLEYKDAHCVTVVPTAEATLGLKELGSGVAITATNAKTASGTTAAEPSILAGTVSGIETELKCTGLEGTGTLTNATSSVTGSGTLIYTGCSVLKPAGKSCVVGNSGKITTKALTASDVGLASNKLKFSPTTGTEFTKIKIESCTVAPLNAEFLVSGTVTGNTSGATTTTSVATVKSEKTLTFAGNPAGLGGAITISTASPANPVVLH